MTSEEAKETLLLYRPGTADAEEPEIVQAMDVVRNDPELAQWFQQHCAFQSAMRARLRQIKAPQHFKIALLAGTKLSVQPAWWQRPAWWSTAVACAALVLLGVFLLWPKTVRFDRFGDYRQMVVSKAMKVGYDMDWTTQNMPELREKIKQRGAPADYAVTPGLEKLKLTGGGTFLWRKNPVAMVCFDRGTNDMVFLFVLQRTGVKDPPPETPQLSKVSRMTTASWSAGDKTYVVAGRPHVGEGDSDFLHRFF